jgi:hypothetical protein
MFPDVEMTSEEEEEVIRKVAVEIRKHGMEAAAILFLESARPLTFIGSQMGRFFISPFLPAISEDLGLKGERLFLVFEKHENIEKLIFNLEQLEREEFRKEPEESEKKPEMKNKPPEKKGWRRFLPF